MDNENTSGHKSASKQVGQFVGDLFMAQFESTSGQSSDNIQRVARLMQQEIAAMDEDDMKNSGLFIVFEGGEGSGKSTQAAKLADALFMRGIPNRLTFEPGDTELGRDLRRFLTDPQHDPLSARAEVLLFALDRAEHVEKVIKPALAKGEVVICDRYIDSSMAYQAYANGMPWEDVSRMSEWASDGLRPDVTYFLDVEPAFGLARARLNKPNYFEEKDVEYHTRVRNGYLELQNHTYLRVDGYKTIDEIHQVILNHAINFRWQRLNPAVPS